MVEALVIGTDVERLSATTRTSDLLECSLEIALASNAGWELVIIGDLLDELERAASRSLHGHHTRLWRAGLALFGGVRGSGMPALVQELGLAANRAARLRRDAHTAFVFRDVALVSALANKSRGPRLGARREQTGLVAVLTNPGYDVPWPESLAARR